MANPIDLDLIVQESIKFKFEGKIYEIQEPCVKQIIAHSDLIDRLEKLREEIQKLAGTENEQEKKMLDTRLKEFQKLQRDFDKEVIKIFIPTFDEYEKLRPSQKTKIFELLFGKQEGDIKKNQEESHTEK